ncbi:MAG: hypothetical protein Q9207_003668 [Kuettlingeria erythrocarpa]
MASSGLSEPTKLEKENRRLARQVKQLEINLETMEEEKTEALQKLASSMATESPYADSHDKTVLELQKQLRQKTDMVSKLEQENETLRKQFERLQTGFKSEMMRGGHAFEAELKKGHSSHMEHMANMGSLMKGFGIDMTFDGDLSLATNPKVKAEQEGYPTTPAGQQSVPEPKLKIRQQRKDTGHVKPEEPETLREERPLPKAPGHKDDLLAIREAQPVTVLPERKKEESYGLYPGFLQDRAWAPLSAEPLSLKSTERSLSHAKTAMDEAFLDIPPPSSPQQPRASVSSSPGKQDRQQGKSSLKTDVTKAKEPKQIKPKDPQPASFATVAATEPKVPIAPASQKEYSRRDMFEMVEKLKEKHGAEGVRYKSAFDPDFAQYRNKPSKPNARVAQQPQPTTGPAQAAVSEPDRGHLAEKPAQPLPPSSTGSQEPKVAASQAQPEATPTSEFGQPSESEDQSKAEGPIGELEEALKSTSPSTEAGNGARRSPEEIPHGKQVGETRKGKPIYAPAPSNLSSTPGSNLDSNPLEDWAEESENIPVDNSTASQKYSSSSGSIRIGQGNIIEFGGATKATRRSGSSSSSSTAPKPGDKPKERKLWSMQETNWRRKE